MTITFISLFQFTVWILATILAVSLYFWLVRPHLMDQEEGREAIDFIDGKLARLWAWIKTRWDVALAAFLAALPSLWNGSLDFIILICRHATDVFPALASADLSGVVMPDWLQSTIRIGGALSPLVRKWLFVDEEDGDNK